MKKLTMLFLGLVLSTTPFLSSPMQAQATSCNAFRVNYENAIRRGIIARPGKVATLGEAANAFQYALERGNRYEASRRLAQYLVIYSERYGVEAAIAEERDFDQIAYKYLDTDIRGALPLFNKIFPLYGNPCRH